jgi:hypothetical protein
MVITLSVHSSKFVKKLFFGFVVLFFGLTLFLAGKALLNTYYADKLGVPTGPPFAIKSDLPYTDQQEIDRLVNIPVAQRTASESAWLLTRSVYQYNSIVLKDANKNIIIAEGNVLPSGTSGFTKGATFHLLNADYNLRGIYENTGNTVSSVWKAIGLQTATVWLASASFDTINTTPVELIPDPGDGKVIELESVTGYRVFASESWSPASVLDGLEVKYDGATGLPLTASFSRGFLDGGASDVTASPSYQTRYAIDVNRASPSEAVYLTSGSNPSIDGDTYFKFDVMYRIVELP